jgi:hypothetical protein
MAGPKRWGFKNMQVLKQQYRTEYWTNFFIGIGLTYPLILMIGRRG